MSKPKSPTSNNAKFWAIASFTLAVAAFLAASTWPALIQYAHWQSDQLVRAGDSAAPSEAEIDYQLATHLNHSNETAAVKLAQTQIATGQPDLALKTLESAGQGRGVERLKIRTLIEQGQTAAATTAANQLLRNHPTAPDLILASLAYALDGRGGDITPLLARTTAPEALQVLRRAQAGNLPLAAELYASGLLRSSSALLMKLPSSYERSYLLASIFYARHTSTDLTQAAGFLTGAIALNPTDISARQLLARVYRDQHQVAQAQVQESLVAKLQTGRP